MEALEMEEVLEVKVVEDLVNVPHHQTALVGLHCAVSGDIARQQTNLTVTQTLGNVPHPQTVRTGLRTAPSLGSAEKQHSLARAGRGNIQQI